MYNILGDNTIQGKPTHKGKDARITYAKTPVFDPESIPAGKTMHIGNGIFRTVCAGGCGAYADTWGPVTWIPELRHHEHYEHGLDIPGVNVALLP